MYSAYQAKAIWRGHRWTVAAMTPVTIMSVAARMLHLSHKGGESVQPGGCAPAAASMDTGLSGKGVFLMGVNVRRMDSFV